LCKAQSLSTRQTAAGLLSAISRIAGETYRFAEVSATQSFHGPATIDAFAAESSR
jgi:hypothetical protein